MDEAPELDVAGCEAADEAWDVAGGEDHREVSASDVVENVETLTRNAVYMEFQNELVHAFLSIETGASKRTEEVDILIVLASDKRCCVLWSLGRLYI